MRRWMWWAVIVAVLGACLWLGLRLGWLDWIAGENHAVRNVLEVLSWVATICGVVYAVVQPFLDRGSQQDASEHDRLDKLACAMWRRWEKEAELRRVRHGPLPIRWGLATRKVAPGLHAAIAEGTRARFAPLPGLRRVTRADLCDGGGLCDLFRVYGGLASGRLLLTGEGASGKTTAGILLLLEALAHRKKAADGKGADIPVPVLLELRDWRPPGETVTEWVARSLSQSERLVRGRAGRDWVKEMLQAGKISVFLDGFDEVAAPIRRIMVAELNEAPFRLVLLSRAKEAVQTNRQCPLSGALGLALRPICAKDAAAYLRRGDLPEPPPRAWCAIIEELRTSPTGPLAKALEYPLAVSLVRDAYTNDDPVDELLNRERYSTARTIRDHLLDQVVKTAYRPKSGRRRYSASTAEQTLRFIADRLVAENTYDLGWWHIPTWVSPRARSAVAGPLAGAVSGSVAVAAHGLRIGLAIGLATMATVILRMSKEREPRPLDTAGWRDILNRATLRYGLVVGGFNLVAMLPIYGRSATGIAYTIWAAIISTLVTTVLLSPAGDLVTGLPHAYMTRMLGVTEDGITRLGKQLPRSAPRAVGPRQVWRHHAYGRLALGLAFGGAIGIWSALAYALAQPDDPQAVLLSGLALAVAFGLISGPAVNLAIMTSMTLVQLRLTKGIPLRLMSFLEDARERNLIRVAGQVYQFRHADLRDRLSRATG